jgi:superfamily II DNA or RNA helicase
VHGKLPLAERDALIAGLASGAIEVLASCEILGEGVDIPTIGAAILLRPTKSLCVYLQQVGRGLRPAPGKSHLVVLDLAGNALVHGLPDEPRAWALAGVPKGEGGEPPGWLCPSCECFNPPGAAFCVDCGAPRPARPRELTTDRQAELVELTRRHHERLIAQLSYRALMARPRTRHELEIYQRAHGYKRGWVWHAQQQLAETFGRAG